MARDLGMFFIGFPEGVPWGLQRPTFKNNSNNNSKNEKTLFGGEMEEDLRGDLLRSFLLPTAKAKTCRVELCMARHSWTELGLLLQYSVLLVLF